MTSVILFLFVVHTKSQNPGHFGTLVIDRPVDSAQKFPVKQFSKLFSALRGKGYSLSMSSTKQQLSLERFGFWSFGNILFLDSNFDELLELPEEARVYKTAFEQLDIATRAINRVESLTIRKLLKFVDVGGRNIVIHANIGEISKGFNEVVETLGFSIHIDIGVVDFFSNMGDPEEIVSDYIPVPNVFGMKGNSVYHNGGLQLGRVVGITSNFNHAYSVVAASSTSMGYKGGKLSLTALHGNEISVVHALEGRNGSRIVVIGATDVCEDKTLRRFPQQLSICISLYTWAFRGHGILVAEESASSDVITGLQSAIWHRRPPYGVQQKKYVVGDTLEFGFQILASVLEKGVMTWKPFRTDDLETTFAMMRPYNRQSMNVFADGSYTCLVRTPDTRGVFKISMEYFRNGLGILRMENHIIIRPTSHNEHSKFRLIACPYYICMITALVMVWVTIRRTSRISRSLKCD